jgi:hypothetical protein
MWDTQIYGCFNGKVDDSQPRSTDPFQSLLIPPFGKLAISPLSDPNLRGNSANPQMASLPHLHFLSSQVGNLVINLLRLRWENLMDLWQWQPLPPFIPLEFLWKFQGPKQMSMFASSFWLTRAFFLFPVLCFASNIQMFVGSFSMFGS